MGKGLRCTENCRLDFSTRDSLLLHIATCHNVLPAIALEAQREMKRKRQLVDPTVVPTQRGKGVAPDLFEPYDTNTKAWRGRAR